MTTYSPDPLLDLLAERAVTTGLGSVVDAALRERLAAYWRLLSKWNARTNLTGFNLESPSAAAVDRLLLEPLFAAQFLPVGRFNWIDVGSGGGSPAIPLKLIRPSGSLTMVEARAKKAAFLREAVRELGLTDTTVVEDRFEALAEAQPDTADVVTSRAVRFDDRMWSSVSLVLNERGRLVIFVGGSGVVPPVGAVVADSLLLPPAVAGSVVVLERI